MFPQNLRQLCHCVIKLCMLECLFIINSLKHTCTLIMLFNQHLYLPHLSGGWIILKWSLTRLSANLYSERYNYFVCEIISFQFVEKQEEKQKCCVVCIFQLWLVAAGQMCWCECELGPVCCIMTSCTAGSSGSSHSTSTALCDPACRRTELQGALTVKECRDNSGQRDTETDGENKKHRVDRCNCYIRSLYWSEYWRLCCQWLQSMNVPTGLVSHLNLSFKNHRCHW